MKQRIQPKIEHDLSQAIDSLRRNQGGCTNSVSRMLADRISRLEKELRWRTLHEVR